MIGLKTTIKQKFHEIHQLDITTYYGGEFALSLRVSDVARALHAVEQRLAHLNVSLFEVNGATWVAGEYDRHVAPKGSRGRLAGPLQGLCSFLLLITMWIKKGRAMRTLPMQSMQVGLLA